MYDKYLSGQNDTSSHSSSSRSWLRLLSRLAVWIYRGAWRGLCGALANASAALLANAFMRRTLDLSAGTVMSRSERTKDFFKAKQQSALAAANLLSIGVLAAGLFPSRIRVRNMSLPRYLGCSDSAVIAGGAAALFIVVCVSYLVRAKNSGSLNWRLLKFKGALGRNHGQNVEMQGVYLPETPYAESKRSPADRGIFILSLHGISGESIEKELNLWHEAGIDIGSSHRIPQSNAHVFLEATPTDTRTLWKERRDDWELLVSKLSPLEWPLGVMESGADFFKRGALVNFSSVFIGTSGAGKTVAMQFALTTYLAVNPKTRLIVADMKKMGDWDVFGPYTESGRVLKSADEATEGIMMAGVIFAERQGILQLHGCANFLDYERKYKVEMPPVLLVIDEWPNLAKLLRFESNYGRVGTAANVLFQLFTMARAAGVWVILGSQYGGWDHISPELAKNTKNKVIMKTGSRGESSLWLDSDVAFLIGTRLGPNGQQTAEPGKAFVDSEKSPVRFWKMDGADIEQTLLSRGVQPVFNAPAVGWTVIEDLPETARIAVMFAVEHKDAIGESTGPVSPSLTLASAGQVTTLSEVNAARALAKRLAKKGKRKSSKNKEHATGDTVKKEKAPKESDFASLVAWIQTADASTIEIERLRGETPLRSTLLSEDLLPRPGESPEAYLARAGAGFISTSKRSEP